MPSAPVFRNTDRKIGSSEVFNQIDSHQLSRSAGHINSAGEISINLYRVKDHGDKGLQAVVLTVTVEYLINQYARAIRDHHFFEVPPEHQLCSKGQIIVLKWMILFQLWTELIITTDRSLNNLGKKRDKKSKSRQTDFCFVLIPVDINTVPDRLKGIKRNPQGKDKVDQRKGKIIMKEPEKAIYIVRCEIVIF